MSEGEAALQHPALIDQESGLANRLHFQLVYHYLFHGADRGVPLTVSTFDVSRDGALPDLGAVGARLKAATRLTDLAAHLGGGRITLLLLGTTLPGARIAVDRVEMALEELGLRDLAIGIAQYRTEMKESRELLDAADGARNRARAMGGGVEMA